MAMEIDQLLLRLSEVNDDMSRYVARQEAASSSLLPILHHHRGKLHDFNQDFKKTQSKINYAREHAQLLSSVRQAIDSYKNSPNGGGGSSNININYLMRERPHLNNSHNDLDSIIGQAEETRQTVSSQRAFLRNTLNRLSDVGGGFPTLNSIIGGIRRAKSRDFVVLGGVISLCICFLLWWWLT